MAFVIAVHTADEDYRRFVNRSGALTSRSFARRFDVEADAVKVAAALGDAYDERFGAPSDVPAFFVVKQTAGNPGGRG